MLLHQLDIINRKNNTNNFAEANFHILKDVVLRRQAALNMVAFVEFCVAVRRLLNVTHNRCAKGRLTYSELMTIPTRFQAESLVVFCTWYLLVFMFGGWTTYDSNTALALTSRLLGKLSNFPPSAPFTF